MKADVRTDLILKAAIAVARRPGGWCPMTRREIATYREYRNG